MPKKMDEATRKRVRAVRMLLAGKRCAEVARGSVLPGKQCILGKHCLMKEESRRCVPSVAGVSQRNWISASLRNCAVHCYRVRRHMVLAPSCGPSSGCSCSSSASSVS